LNVSSDVAHALATSNSVMDNYRQVPLIKSNKIRRSRKVDRTFSPIKVEEEG